MTIKRISSAHNTLFKQWLALHEKARERKKEGLFLAEGLREVGMALRNGFEVEILLFDESFTSPSLLEDWWASLSLDGDHARLVSLDTTLFRKFAYRSAVPNVVAVLKTRYRSVHELPLSACPLLLLVDNVEKPGNLGAMLRTADAAGVDAVLVCDQHTDIWNPNVIRASLGAAFSVPLACLPAADALTYLKEHQIKVLVTSLHATNSVHDADLKEPLAFVVGTEADGVSAFWQDMASKSIIIPMHGQVDSLNVSAAAAVVLFEAVRQRRTG
jgi:TrmH family RNA methyltransferase